MDILANMLSSTLKFVLTLFNHVINLAMPLLPTTTSYRYTHTSSLLAALTPPTNPQLTYANFRAEVELERASDTSQSLAAATLSAPLPDPATAADPSAAQHILPPELATLPQSERVKRFTTEVHALFCEWDCGRMSTDILKARLKTLGIELTSSALFVLARPPVQFGAFLRALSQEDAPEPTVQRPAAYQHLAHVPVAEAFMPAGGRVHAGGKGRRGASALDNHQDIISWHEEHSGAAQAEATLDSALSASGATRARYDNRHALESGAGALIRGEQAPAGVTYADLEFKATTAMRRAEPKQQSLQRGSGAASALRNTEYRPDETFESVAAAAARQGLGTRGSERPITSAGYRTTDGGLLREQVYSLVRQLDSGDMNVADFRLAVQRLGLPVTPVVERLLANYKSNGKARFSDFVRAFEDYFAAMTTAAPEEAEESEASQLEQAAAASGATGLGPRRQLGRAGTRAAQRGHGDIVGWNSVPTDPTELRQFERLQGRRPELRRNRSLYDSTPENVVTWVGADRPPLSGLVNAHGKVTRKGSGEMHAARRGHGNIVQWVTDAPEGKDGPAARAGVTEFPQAYGGSLARGGDVLPGGARTGRGRALPNTKLAHAERYGTGTPFGTQHDMPHPDDARPPAPPNFTSPTFGGGSYLSDAHAMQNPFSQGGGPAGPPPPASEHAPAAFDMAQYSYGAAPA